MSIEQEKICAKLLTVPSQAAVRARICGGHVSQLPKTSQKIACFTPDYVLQYASVNILTMKLICSNVK